MGRNADAKDHWREIHARHRGPLVAKLQGAFQQHWVRAAGEALSGPDEFPDLPAAGNLRAQMVASHSFSVAPLPLVQADSDLCCGEADLRYERLLHAER
jgi:cardiolipin synthase